MADRATRKVKNRAGTQKNGDRYLHEKTSGKGKIVFYSIYAGLTFLIIAATAVFLSRFKPYLASFEAGLPKYKAQEIFERYFDPADFGALYDKCGIKLSEYEGKKEFVGYMTSLVGARPLSYRDVPSGDDAVKRYVVTDGVTKIGEFTLVEKGEGDENGNRWIENSFRLFYAATESIRVRVPSDSRVFVNEREVDLSSVETVITEDERNKHLPEGVGGITYTAFSLDGFLVAPSVRAVDRFGNDGNITYDEKEKTYVSPVSYELSVPDEVYKLAEGAAQSYAKYMTLDATLGAVQKYFDPSSDIYSIIKKSDTRWYTPHSGYKFESAEASEYYVYGEGVFSCRYKCDQRIITTWEKFDFPLDVTLYFRNVNGKPLVYDMVTNN